MKQLTKILEAINEDQNPKPITRSILTQAQMVSMGGNYNLQHGMLMNIPVDMIDGLDPEPSMWSDDDGEYHDFTAGQQIKKPIEVVWEADQNVYLMQDGNHRVKQAKLNGDKFIKAFVQSNDRSYYRKWMNL
tara:strand:- start:376 stop:771 length:396 start_codon:yes stop_codon:yes gene_type:complete